jgi:hypothetical protein
LAMAIPMSATVPTEHLRTNPSHGPILGAPAPGIVANALEVGTG